MIGAARGQAHRHVEAIFADQLTAARRAELDGLLDTEGGRSSELAELRRRATRTGVRELRVQVTRYLRLLELDAAKIDASALPPARRRTLEAMGRRMSAQQLRRLEPARRHPLLLVLLRALVIERGDEAVDEPHDGPAQRIRAARGSLPGARLRDPLLTVQSTLAVAHRPSWSEKQSSDEREGQGDQNP